MAWTAPRTWVDGETVTATLLNTHLRDNLKAIGDPWTAYTPAWTAATTNPALGNGTLVGAYLSLGKLVVWRIRLTIGSTTTLGSGIYSFSLPVNGNPDGIDAAGQGIARDNSPVAYSPLTARIVAGTVDLITGSGSRVDQATPFAWATGDTIAVGGVYEAA